jgi:hypothetical protein
MESLESKLDRLAPEQRKEVEEFVDFLLYRSGNSHEPSGSARLPPEIRKVAPPLLSQMEPLHVPENSPASVYDVQVSESLPPAGNGQGTDTIREINPDGDDRVSREYMDYGQFDQTPSPATTAVKKVKEKLQKREENEKPRVSLDWIE